MGLPTPHSFYDPWPLAAAAALVSSFAALLSAAACLQQDDLNHRLSKTGAQRAYRLLARSHHPSNQSKAGKWRV
jgi:hypothetical protein